MSGTFILAFGYPRNDTLGTIVFTIIFLSVPVLFYYFAVRWACEDAEARNMSKVVAVVLVVVFFPIGWLFWLVMRPKKREFDFELYKHTARNRDATPLGNGNAQNEDRDDRL